MLNIDDIERMTSFPNLTTYFKKSIFNNIAFLLPISMIIVLFFDDYFLTLCLLLGFFITITIVNFRLDKRIFKAFESRRKKSKT